MPPLSLRLLAITRALLITAHVLVGLTAVMGGIGLIATNGLGMPLSLIAPMGFSSYVIPGVILAVVIGGTGLVGGLAVARNHPLQYEASAVASFGLLVWLFCELYFLGDPNPLQLMYSAVAIACLVAKHGLMIGELQAARR